jgi:hypothetical protein
MHVNIRLFPALILMTATGCGGGNDDPAALSQQVKKLEAQVNRMATSVEACRTSMRQVESTTSEADFHVKQVPKLTDDVEALKSQLAEAAKILKGVTTKDGYLVVPGMIVANDKGKPHCLVSNTGLTIFDAKGKRVGQLSYDEVARAMTATLNSHGTKSVALYAGDDRVAIGAYDSRADRPVGWAATVTKGGEVTVGRSESEVGHTSGTTSKRTRPVSK